MKASCRILHAQYDPIYIKFKYIQKNATFYVGIQIYSKNRIKHMGPVRPELKLGGGRECNCAGNAGIFNHGCILH